MPWWMLSKPPMTSGATNVKNHLRIRELRDRPWKELTDRELKEAVEDELYWSPFVNSVQIRVQVRNGIVTQSGRVETHGEIADAVENASEAGAKKFRSLMDRSDLRLTGRREAPLYPRTIFIYFLIEGR